MITEKIAEFVYEKASRFFSKGRIVCFLISCLLISDQLLSILSVEFWKGSVSEASTSLASAILDIPLYLAVTLTATAFGIAPYLSKHYSLFIMSFEVKRAQNAMDRIDSDIAGLSTETIRLSLVNFQKNAVSAQHRLDELKQLNESLIFFNLVAIGFSIFSDVQFYFYCILIVTPFALYFSAQEILSIYLKKIYFYKKAIEHLESCS